MENNFYRITQSGSKTIVDIYRAKLLKFWDELGFKKLKMPKGGYSLVQIKNNSIISEVQKEELMHAVKYKLLNEDDVPLVWEEFLSGDYINKNNYLALETIRELRLNLSTKNTAYFFFRNGVLKVTPNTMDIIDYNDYQGYIHEDQIIQHDINLENNQQSEFDEFLKKVSGNDEARYQSLTTAIGYLLHSYKDLALTKAIILVDEELDFSGEANGGTGKSIIAKAVQYMTSSIFKDGKALHHKSNRFFYQDINLYHRVLIIDDVNVDFEFETFYSVITGEMQVEEKYKAAYKIPFELSPKLLITSNYMVKGSGGNSDERRRIEIEIFPYYKRDFTPIDDFKHRFFSDWKQEEWNPFFIGMAKYCQNYLRSGIVYPTPINLAENKLKQNTDQSFVEFADLNLIIPTDKDSNTLNKATLYDDYRHAYPVESRNVTAIKFKKWIDEYCKFRGLEAYHFKSDSNNLIKITKI